MFTLTGSQSLWIRQLSYYKVLNGILQIATGVTKYDGNITNCESLVYYKLQQLSYCKMLHGLLKIATGRFHSTMIITNCDSQGPVECIAPSHLSQSWSHLVGQSSSNNHYISLALKKSRKKLIVSIWGNNEFNRRKFPFDIPKAFRKQTKWFAIWCSVY